MPAPPRSWPRPTRRAVLSGASASLAGWLIDALRLPGLGLPRAWSADGSEPPELRTARRGAIRRACAWIQTRQHAQGSFGKDDGIVALSALAVLALMAEGSTDGRGPYGASVRRGLDYLLRLVEQPKHGGAFHEGYFYAPNDASSRMHGQGFATLALATAMGTSTDARYRRMRDVVRKAVACIEQAQTGTGGFGYEPKPGGDHEGSVTVTVAQGLRAARDAGVPVDQNVVDRGLHYLKKSQNADGSFRYAMYVERSSYALTAAALSSFLLYGRYGDDRERTMARGFDYMLGRVRDVQRGDERWYYYGNFYAAWSCWQRDGDDWDPASRGSWARWHRAMLPHVLARQSAQGWWEDPTDTFEFGELYPTAFAALTLAIPDETLPIFQR